MEAQEVQGDARVQKFLEDWKKPTESVKVTARERLKLRLKSISECLQETGVIQNKDLFKEIFQIITPSSQVVLFSDVQEDILNILKVATKNGVEEDLIRMAFEKVKLNIKDLEHLELMSYSTLINFSHIKVKGKKDFSEDEWKLISNNIIHCGQVCLYDSTLPIYHQPKLMESTSAAADKRDKMKLEKLTFSNMPISSKQAMTVANLACFTEKVQFKKVRISQASISHICEHLMKQKQQRLKEIEFRNCPIMHPDMKRKMEENGVEIQECDQKYIFLLYERENRDFVLSINEKLQNDEYSVVIDDNFEEFTKQHPHPLVVLIFVHQKISDELENKIFFAQHNQFAIVFVKWESDFEPSHALSSLFENSPFIDFSKIGNPEEKIVKLQRMVSAVIVTFPQYRHKLFKMGRELHEMAETFPHDSYKFFEMGRELVEMAEMGKELHKMAETFPQYRHKWLKMGTELREMAETFPHDSYKLSKMGRELHEMADMERHLREIAGIGMELHEMAETFSKHRHKLFSKFLGTFPGARYKLFETFPESRIKSLGSTTNVEEPVADLQVKSTKESIDNSKEPMLTGRVEQIVSGILDLHSLELVPSDLLSLQPPSTLSFHEVSSLDISSNNLDHLPPSFFQQFKGLTDLNLSNNKIRFLSSNSGDWLPQLEVLNLSKNELRFLPEHFGSKFGKLKQLMLSENKICELSHNFGDWFKCLEFLNLDDNLIIFLPSSFTELNINIAYSIENNPMVIPPISVCNSGMPAIKRYFSENKLVTISENTTEDLTQKLQALQLEGHEESSIFHFEDLDVRLQLFSTEECIPMVSRKQIDEIKLDLELGESILSDIITVESESLFLFNSANLTMPIASCEQPFMTNIVAKHFDLSKNEWNDLPVTLLPTSYEGEPPRSHRYAQIEIRQAGIYVICLVLKSFQFEVCADEDQTEVCPFGEEIGVKIIFPRGSFESASEKCTAKINIFTQSAKESLRNLGVESTHILHVTSQSGCLKKPVEIMMPYRRGIQQKGDFFLLQGNGVHDCEDVTSQSNYCFIGDKVIFQVQHFSWFLFGEAYHIFFKLFDKLRIYVGPGYNVSFHLFGKRVGKKDNREVAECKISYPIRENLHRHKEVLKECGYQAIDFVSAEEAIYPGMKLNIGVEGMMKSDARSFKLNFKSDLQVSETFILEENFDADANGHNCINLYSCSGEDRKQYAKLSCTNLFSQDTGSRGTVEDSTETRTDKNSGEDSTKSQEGHVMLSYQWDSQAQVLRIKNKLDKLGYKTWMDVVEMHGNVNKRMAEGVQGAAVVVVFMTQKYEESHNCKKELNYADDKRKKIVPVKLEPKYKPSKALGLIVAGKLYTVFSGESQFESNFADLRKEIDAALGATENTEQKNKLNDAFSGLREKYQKDCSRHEVNCVDTMENCIISLDLDINDFSVNLKIVQEEKRCTAKDQTYHNELEKHLHLLKDNAKAIEVGELMKMIEDNEKERIMFVSGLAGIGKSVLAKKVALDWACKECSQTRCLFYITCRQLNSFFHESDSDIEEFLKKQFRNVPLENVETTVFLIDGLDELQEPVKIVKAFTDKFSKSKFIILGRPHAKHHVNSIGQKSQKLEILGLNDGQIEEYIKKFPKLSTDKNQDESSLTEQKIKEAIQKSKNISYIATIPQFLNTICCAVMLSTEGKSFTSKTDLYSWMLFLLIKQHFQDKQSDNQNVGWEVFSHYSEQLLAICKQAFKLYSSGSIIFKKTELECEDEKFIEGFLLGVKNKAGVITKYMFKHLTIMEFLASIHVYLDGKRNELLEELLREERYEIISFVCSFVRFSLVKETSFEEDDEMSYQLIEQLANGKEVAKNCGDGEITYEDAQSVIRDILNQIEERNRVRCTLNKLEILNGDGSIGYGDAQNFFDDINELQGEKVLLKVRFLADCFVASDKVLDAKFLVELLKSIKPSSNVELWLDTFDQRNLLSILKLVTGNKVANSEIKNAFSGIGFHINDLREMEILAYALWINIGRVQLNDVNHLTEQQSMLVHRNVAFCGRVRFTNCKFPLFTTNANESTTRMQLNWLTMARMRIEESDVSSAANLFGWVGLVELRDVRVGGKQFEKIVDELIQIKPRRLKKMDLYNCPLVNHDIKQKMIENGVIISEAAPTSILLLCKPDSRNFVLQLKENLDDTKYYIAMDDNIEEFKRQYNELPYILVVFIQHQIPEEIERDILFAQQIRKSAIVFVKLEADFHPNTAISSVFDSNPCLDFTDKRNNAEMATIDLNRMTSAIIDRGFIIISNAPGNQVEAIQIKQKFADEFGCPVFVNIKLWKYCPRVVVVLLTDGYEESIQCKEMMEYAEYLLSPNIIAVKLDSDFQPGDELNKIVRESTCICWTDETNFDTNFAKVKEEINAEFAW